MLTCYNCVWHGGTVHSSVASQQESPGFPLRALMAQGNRFFLGVVGLTSTISRGFLCGDCMFSPCEDGVSSIRTPMQEEQIKNRLLYCPVSLTGHKHLDLVPGRRSTIRSDHCSRLPSKEYDLDGLKAEETFQQ